MQSFQFEPATLPAHTEALREQVRSFIAAHLRHGHARDSANSWTTADPDFSRKLGERGWIGMTWPRQYGGRECSSLERYVVIEELLAVGAPVGAHWIADRQSGPTILRYGTEEQCAQLLPGITRGETYFCIGMSEPNAGSDLAGVRTRADKVPGGWRINGQKIWTTNAQYCQWMIALVRTAPVEGSARHQGLTQFLIDMNTPGIEVRPIADLVGGTHFNEVFFTDVMVPDSAVLGAPGNGWAQVTSELSLERSGPERYLSSFALLRELIRYARLHSSPLLTHAIGRLSAELWTLRQMSLSVAGQLARGKDPYTEAAIVKDLGNSFEQVMPELVQGLLDDNAVLDGDSDLEEILAHLLQVAPSFSLRGGTREVLRGIIARALGLR